MQKIKDLIQNDEKMLQIDTFFIRIMKKILRRKTWFTYKATTDRF